MSRIRAAFATCVLVGAAACAPAVSVVAYGNGFSIRHERDRSPLGFTGYRNTLLFNGEAITDGRFDMSASKRFVFFTAHGNWYLFDAVVKKPRFLRNAAFDCSVKFYEERKPPFLRCFDVWSDQMVEIALQ